MFCHKCGSKLLDEAVFCHECGAKLVQGETTQPMSDASGSTNASELAELIPQQAIAQDDVKPAESVTTAIFKCKMCGGDIHAKSNAAYGTCDSCGITSTLPRANEERIVNLFNRANHLRRLNEFDKALSVYENILSEDAVNAEAHWCAVLCRYGIEYVEDPKSHQRVPTCHRTQNASILKDADYHAALKNAPDSYTRSLYEDEVKKINKIQKGILAISSREEPFDIFICYKEATDGGSRTKDSSIAQDVYHQLTNDGYRVFFSKITLEEKLGHEYEPYIFNALNSAKVMLVIGTKKENFEAVWVKNEWSRFLTLAKTDRSRLLIPCYRDMDPHDIPEELAMLQSQDMSKIGFMQDLTRGIKKLFDAAKVSSPSATAAASAASAASSGTPKMDSLMKRGRLFLDDGDWKQAEEYFNRVLDIDPEFAPAYIGLLCAELGLSKEEDLAKSEKPLSGFNSFKNALRYTDKQKKLVLEEYDRLSTERFKKKQNFLKFCMEGKNKLAAGRDFSACITPYKTVVTTSKEIKCSGWNNMAAILAEGNLTGLRNDGKMLTTSNLFDTIKWGNIISIAEGTQTMGVHADGSVVMGKWFNEELRLKIEKWKDITAVSAGGSHIVGLKKDGSVVVVANKDVSDYGQLDLKDWRNIAEVISVGNRTIGLQTDGSVIFCGVHSINIEKRGDSWTESYPIAKNVKRGTFTYTWKNIISISGGPAHTVALKKDGTVVADGKNAWGECNVSGWRDIVAISAGARHTLGLTIDGTVLAAGDNSFGQCNTQGWLGFCASAEKIAEQENILKEERKKQDAIDVEKAAIYIKQAAIERANKPILKQHREWYSSFLCGFCGGKTTLFGKCKSCGKTRDDWSRYGEYNLIKELKLGEYVLGEHNAWYDAGKCGFCGDDVTLFLEKCKSCERKRSQWKEDGEKDLRRKLGLDASAHAEPTTANMNRTKEEKTDSGITFKLMIKDRYSIPELGTAISGKIEEGIIKTNDCVELVKTTGQTRKIIVIGIKTTEIVESAKAGDYVGIILEDIEEEEVDCGDVIIKRS